LKRFSILIILFFLASLLAGISPQYVTQAADTPVVHAVLFYSPSCGHCQKVITEDLPPLIDKYQDHLLIIGVDVSLQNGQLLYQSAIDAFQIAQERWGVPTLIVGNIIMVGSDEIPNQFPGLIEQGLANGGVPWPDIPGLAEALAAEPPPSESQVEHAAQSSLTISERFALDPVANTISVVVLIGMLISVVMVGLNFSKVSSAGPRLWPNWVMMVLILVGLFAAGYLTYVEVTDTTAICGPIGDCNVVQQSSYARLFGVLPVGVLGMIGYLAILVFWLIVQFGKPDQQRLAGLALWGLTWFGTLFSVYLTFLEPFVIGASCAWCLTSAVAMTLLLWATTPIAQKQIQKRPKTFRRSRPPASPVEG
jgi:uncharacterized membrane protein